MEWFIVYMMLFPYYGNDTPFQMFPVASEELCIKKGEAWKAQMADYTQTGIPKYKCIQLPTAQ